jgi:hypothetical protein
VEEYAVADHVPVGCRRHVLLRLVHGEAGHRVDRCIAEQLERIPTAHIQVHHVVRLVEEHGAVLPRPLLAAPVAEFRRDHRVDVGAELRVAQHLHGVPGLRQDLFQIARRHYRSPIAGRCMISHFVSDTNDRPGTRRGRAVARHGDAWPVVQGLAITTLPNSSREDWYA